MGVVTNLETAGRFTRADFEALPVDGRRYELLDGAIVVSPSPSVAHQRAAGRLFMLLVAAVPPGLEVFMAPLDAYLPTGDILEPDVMVIDPAIVVDDRLQGGVPLLAVEVVSPSSRRRDVGDKLTAYRDAGVPSYWVVDVERPRLRSWRLTGGEYVAEADVSGEETWTSAVPFAVTVRPAALVR